MNNVEHIIVDSRVTALIVTANVMDLQLRICTSMVYNYVYVRPWFTITYMYVNGLQLRICTSMAIALSVVFRVLTTPCSLAGSVRRDS